MRALKTEIQLQARVQCLDGPGGEVTHLVVRPAGRTVVGLVVKEGQAPHVERVVPFRSIQESSGGQVRLACSLQELSELPPFRRVEFVETTSWWHGRGPAEYEKVERETIPDDEVALGADTQVHASDGHVGRVQGLTLQPASGAIARLTLRESGLLGARLITVLISEVASLGGEVVSLTLDRAGVQALRAAAHKP